MTAAATALAAGCSALDPEPAPEVIRIAADLELSGAGADLGQVYRNALELRVDQLNQQGLVGNRELELVIKDNRTDSATSASNVAEFASDDDITAIVMGSCAPCLLASADMINETGVPTLTMAAPRTVATPVDERRYIFKLGPNAQDSARTLASALARDDVNTLGIIAGDRAYDEEGLQAMASAAGRAGIGVLVEQQVSADTAAMQATAEQLVGEVGTGDAAAPVTGALPGSVPDAVVLWASPSVASGMGVHLREAGYAGDLYLNMTAADSLFLTGASAAALDGAIMAFTESLVIDEVIATSPAKTARKTWFNDYTARYGTYHAFSSFAADAVQLIVETVNKIDSKDRDALRAAIERTQMDGLTGPLRISPDNHSALTSLGLTTVVVRGDRWRLAG